MSCSIYQPVPPHLIYSMVYDVTYYLRCPKAAANFDISTWDIHESSHEPSARQAAQEYWYSQVNYSGEKFPGGQHHSSFLQFSHHWKQMPCTSSLGTSTEFHPFSNHQLRHSSRQKKTAIRRKANIKYISLPCEPSCTATTGHPSSSSKKSKSHPKIPKHKVL